MSYQLLKDFLLAWPYERVQNMTLEEYNNSNRADSFCYWLEYKSKDLGSIKGGNSLKFGIYKKSEEKLLKDTSVKEESTVNSSLFVLAKSANSHNFTDDNEYIWFKKYGETRDEAFNTVKGIIVNIINCVRNGNFEAIDDIDLGFAVKWKIAFLYSDYKLFNTFTKEMLLKICEYLNIPSEKKESTISIQKKILATNTNEEDYYEFSSKLWEAIKVDDTSKRYWLYAPGKGAKHWGDFYKKGIMGLGWDQLGDLEQYTSKSEIEKSLKELEDVTKSHRINATANFDFLKTIQIGDVIIVKEGRSKLLGYGVVSSDYYYDESRETYQKCREVEWQKKGLWEITEYSMPIKTLTDITLESTIVKGEKNYQFLLNKMKEPEPNPVIELLKYKKQIILQGPPGTGKTREAEAIANEIFDKEINNLLDEDYFVNTFIKDYKFKLKHGEKTSIVNSDGNKIILDKIIDFKPVTFTIDKVINCYKSEDYKAKDFVEYNQYATRSVIIDLLDTLKKEKLNNQFKLIQFHPSYTYEDFVRGIVSKPNEDGDGIMYEAENKIIGSFAQEAFRNFIDSSKPVLTTADTNTFQAFLESVKEQLSQDEGYQYNITDAVYLFSADETRFKYKGDNWIAHNKGLNMKFSELKKIIDSGAKERQDIKKMTDLEELTRQHATYFMKVVEKYYEFKSSFKPENPKVSKVELKNYILVIDEINRANLSSVLGELIYALEYRNKHVESMYSIDGDNQLILPPNLYIIGTMNTADRSVGHIDYAIRRRFAFVDVLPRDLSDDPKLIFDGKLFHEVSELFDSNLSPEFEKKDVQLGHSYFIDKSENGGSMSVRLKYEIKPLLLEYVKDGVLIGEDIRQKIESLTPFV